LETSNIFLILLVIFEGGKLECPDWRGPSRMRTPATASRLVDCVLPARALLVAAACGGLPDGDVHPDRIIGHDAGHRRISGSKRTDDLIGLGHHQLPSMPRPSLWHAQEPVRAFCAKHGIAYRDSGFFASYAQVLRHPHTVGSLRPELEY
jgi:hypothetical protein